MNSKGLKIEFDWLVRTIGANYATIRRIELKRGRPVWLGLSATSLGRVRSVSLPSRESKDKNLNSFVHLFLVAMFRPSRQESGA